MPNEIRYWETISTNDATDINLGTHRMRRQIMSSFNSIYAILTNSHKEFSFSFEIVFFFGEVFESFHDIARISEILMKNINAQRGTRDAVE